MFELLEGGIEHCPGDRGAIEEETFVERNEVRARVAACAEPRRPERRIDERAHGTLPIRARHMDDAQGVLRITHRGTHRTNGVQPRLHAKTRTALKRLLQPTQRPVDGL